MQNNTPTKSNITRDDLIRELCDIQQFWDDADFEYMRGTIPHAEMIEFKQKLEVRATEITKILDWKLIK